MENGILTQLPFDWAYILIGLFAIMAILFLMLLVTMGRLSRLSREYDIFMQGKDAGTLEDAILDQIEEVKMLKAEVRGTKDSIRTLNRNFRASYQKFGLVRYNAFKGMGGSLSFAISMLDYTNSGFVLNCVHSREGCYLYIKEVDVGQTDVVLGSEEKEALEQALGYVKKGDK